VERGPRFGRDQNDRDFAIALIEATMAAPQSSSGAIWSSALASWRPVDWSMLIETDACDSFATTNRLPD
jgi:hypothetical protein